MLGFEFTKMQATGNDFIVIDWREPQANIDLGVLSQKMAHRHLGVGCDQVLFLCHSSVAAFKMRVYNADGFEAEMSGNGMRCFAKYVFDHKLIHDTTFIVETLAGIIIPKVYLDAYKKVESVCVNMGPARSFQKLKLKSEAFKKFDRTHFYETKDLNDDELWVYAVSMGNPHAVLLVKDAEKIPLEVWGPVVERHPHFSNRTNFEVVSINSDNVFFQRTWERGAKETLACGTGACAVAYTLHHFFGFSFPIRLTLKGGLIEVNQNTEGHLLKTGKVENICRGEYFLPQS